MAFTERVTFYERNRINDDSTFTFTTADTDSAYLLYDNGNSPQLASVSSSDGTNEIWKIQLDDTRSIDTILIANHNIKTGNLKYSTDDITYYDFSTAISWTANTDTTSAYNFTEVDVLYLKLTVSYTQDTGEKKVGELKALLTIGSVESNPSQGDPNFNEKKNISKTADGGQLKTLFGQKYNVNFKFKLASENDYSLFHTLSRRNEPFYVYPGGGGDNAEIGYRLEDMYLVNYLNDFKYKLRNGLFGVGIDIDVQLGEV